MSKFLKSKSLWMLLLILSLPLAVCGAETHPILPLGASAPNFALPGVDGKIHKLSDYASSKILVVVFTCDHCPIAQMYEQRIQKLADDYRNRGVAVVAIQPNDPKATRIDELDSSDTGDTLADMKTRVEYKHLRYPYLYDGATQSVARAYGPQATPHVFIFDRQRHLRYEGAFDNSYRIELVKPDKEYARNAVNELLANKQVAIQHTGVFGCSTKWAEKQAASVSYMQKLEAQPITLEMASAATLKALRANKTNNYVLIDFWATWCGSCLREFADLQDTFRMYNDRNFSLVTVSVNMPDEKAGVMRWLNKTHATSRNLLFDSTDTSALQAAFDPKWESAVPYTVLLAPGGKVLYRTMGDVDLLKLRRTILANMPSDYIGFNKYWQGN